jgi:hypothetical protein
MFKAYIVNFEWMEGDNVGSPKYAGGWTPHTKIYPSIEAASALRDAHNVTVTEWKIIDTRPVPIEELRVAATRIAKEEEERIRKEKIEGLKEQLRRLEEK